MLGIREESWREEYGGSWGVELAVLLLLLAVASAVSSLSDPDLPMHLAMGEWIVKHGALPVREPFAWTREGAPYFAYSWLLEVVMYWIHRAAGAMGLRILQGVLVTGAAGVILVLARAAGWRLWTGIILAAIQIFVMSIMAAFLRPQIVLFIAVPLAWALAYRILLDGATPLRLAGVFAVSALAANSHLLFPLTAAPLILLLGRGATVGAAYASRAREITMTARARRLGMFALATALGWLATPYALDWIQIFQLNFAPNPLFSHPTPISELIPGILVIAHGVTSLLIIAGSLALLPWIPAVRALTGRERLAWAAAWLAGLFAFAYAVRALLIWWMLIIPLAALALEPLARAPRRGVIRQAQRAALAVMVILLVLGRVGELRHPWQKRAIRHSRSLPTRTSMQLDPVAEWLECELGAPVSGAIMPIKSKPRAFTTFSLGTYLNWRYPALSYSIDGRNIFPDSVASAESYHLASRDTLPLGPWRTADLAIVSSRYPVAAVLDSAPGWRKAVTFPPLGKLDTVAVWVHNEKLGIGERQCPVATQSPSEAAPSSLLAPAQRKSNPSL
jgi:hypothetical protein